MAITDPGTELARLDPVRIQDRAIQQLYTRLYLADLDDEPRGPWCVLDLDGVLEAVDTTSETRLDPVQGEWVAVAAHRQGRPYLPPTDKCPLCPSTPDRHTEIPAFDYDVVVFENRFPAFSHRFPCG